MRERRELLKEFEEFARQAPNVDALMQRISHRLHEEMSRYNWVGFYLLDTSSPNTLVLGPYKGSFTPHARIDFAQGLCGAAAASQKTIVVDNVTRDPRYLAGSDQTKSEIVVPIFAHKRFIAELDVNSYFTATFAGEERKFVESCAAMIGKFVETHMP